MPVRTMRTGRDEVEAASETTGKPAHVRVVRSRARRKRAPPAWSMWQEAHIAEHPIAVGGIHRPSCRRSAEATAPAAAAPAAAAAAMLAAAMAAAIIESSLGFPPPPHSSLCVPGGEARTPGRLDRIYRGGRTLRRRLQSSKRSCRGGVWEPDPPPFTMKPVICTT